MADDDTAALAIATISANVFSHVARTRASHMTSGAFKSAQGPSNDLRGLSAFLEGEGPGRFMGDSWEVHGRFMKGSWEVHGRLTGG